MIARRPRITRREFARRSLLAAPVENATSRAIEVRDRECFHPFCEIRVDDCQADHIKPYGEGGLTVEDNGRLACPRHNRNRHRRT